jgi:hypothetical protein
VSRYLREDIFLEGSKILFQEFQLGGLFCLGKQTDADAVTGKFLELRIAEVKTTVRL